MKHADLIGSHRPNGGEGLTIQDLLDLLKSIPPQARGNYVMVIQESGETGDSLDVVGLDISQSDQAEKWDFRVYLKVQL